MSPLDFYTLTADSASPEKRTIFKQILIGAGLFVLASFLCFLYLEYRRPVVHAIKYLNSSPPRKGDQIDVAVFIISQLKNVKERQAIRKTWLNEEDKHLSLKIIHYFVIGYLDTSKQDWDTLQMENEQYADILPLPTYDNVSKLTWKVSEMFYWFHYVGLMEYGFQYLLKCDDSSYVRMDKVTESLKQIEEIYTKPHAEGESKNNSDFFAMANVQDNNYGCNPQSKALYWGYFSGNSNFENDQYKWHSCDNFNPYAYGGGYILSATIVGFLANNINYLRHYHSEDVSVGAWLAPVNNIVRIHDRRFDTEYVSRGCQNYYLVRHNIAVDEMKELYFNLKEKQQLCTEEKRTRKEYIYDWSVPPSKCCERVIE